MGCLRIHIQRLQRAVGGGDPDRIAEESAFVQSALLDLLKAQQLLSSEDQQAVRKRMVSLRQEAIKMLEVSRFVLDSVLRAVLELIAAVDDSKSQGFIKNNHSAKPEGDR